MGEAEHTAKKPVHQLRGHGAANVHKTRKLKPTSIDATRVVGQSNLLRQALPEACRAHAGAAPDKNR
jgi:hypothetical protein